MRILSYLMIMCVILLTGCAQNDKSSGVVPQPNTVETPQTSTSDASRGETEQQDSTSNETNAEPGQQTSTNRTDRISSIQNRLQQDVDGGESGEQRFRMTNAPFSNFNDQDGYTKFVGVDLSEIQRVLGDPPVLVRQSVAGAPIRKEVRVYFPYEEDSTGLYLYIKNEKVEAFRLDTFLGLQNSDVLEYFSSN
jgi:hypothetical protein